MLHVSSHAGTPGNLFAGTNAYVYNFNSNTIASGNLVVLFVATNIRTVSTITGTNLTSMVRHVQSSFNPNSNDIGDLWQGISTGSVTSVTITLSGATSDNACVGYVELSGENADQSGATGNSAVPAGTTTHDSGSVTPPTADNVIVAAAMRNNATWTDDGAFTMVSAANANCMMGYILQSSATAQEFNSTSDINRDSVMVIGAFAGEGGGPAPTAGHGRGRELSPMGWGLSFGRNFVR